MTPVIAVRLRVAWFDFECPRGIRPHRHGPGAKGARPFGVRGAGHRENHQAADDGDVVGTPSPPFAYTGPPLQLWGNPTPAVLIPEWLTSAPFIGANPLTCLKIDAQSLSV
jgi:hypothetical protein